MKKILFLLFILPTIAGAQKQFPSYPAIVDSFFSNYGFVQADPVDGLNFAKKKDGWHVQTIDRMTEAVKDDQLFWSAETGHYLELYNYMDPAEPEEKSDAISKFIQQESSYRFYGYERCRYYGYNRWAEDMMQDFGGGPYQNYPDTLLEGLARAYSAYSSKFFWYQFGGYDQNTDSLKRKLGPLELPSPRRTDSLAFYLSKSIEVYKVLAEKNNSYRLIVGNPQMKVVNEQMNAFMQLSFAGYDVLAKKYLDDIKPNPALTALARNYLDACAPNAILFTYGDNDTYPLWYVQQKENYRKDVAVLNTSLLGFPIYIHTLARYKTVAFSTPSSFYGDPAFVYFIKQGESQDPLSVQEFLNNLQSRKNEQPDEYYGTVLTFPQEQVTLSVDLERFKKLAAVPELQPEARIPL